MFTINLKVTTKIIKVIADKHINEIKQNHKRYLISPKKDRNKKKKKGKKNRLDKQKTDNNMIDLNLTISIIN